MPYHGCVTHSAELRSPTRPYFSICIPEYNRAAFLFEALVSISDQQYRDFEICVSDDCSPEARHSEIVDFLAGSGMFFAFVRQGRNLRYDGNLRAAIGLARGRYCFLLGNDDRLATARVLGLAHAAIEAAGDVGALITNYADIPTGQVFRRVQRDGLIGAGPDVAASAFRDFSFVSGVVLRRDLCAALETDGCDGTEMYQMYLGTSIVALGKSLLGLDLIAIEKNIQLPELSVDSYVTQPPSRAGWPRPKILPLGRMGALVARSLGTSVDSPRLDRLTWNIFRQLLVFTYPFWLIEYRRVQSWKYSLEVCMGMRPRYQLEGLTVAALTRRKIQALYLLVSTMGLLLPVRIYDCLQPVFYRLAKRKRPAVNCL